MAIKRGGAVLALLLAALTAVLCASRGDDGGLDACRDAAKSSRADAVSLCERAWARTHAPRAAGYLALAQLVAGRYHDVIAWTARVPDDLDGAYVWHLAGNAYQALGRDDDAVVAYEHALRLRRGRAPALASFTASALAQLAQSQGRYGDAVRLAIEAWRDAHQAGTPITERLALVGIADLLEQLGDVHASEVAIGEAEAITRDGDPMSVQVAIAGARMHAARGRRRMAREALLRQLQSAAIIEDAGDLMRVELALAELDLQDGSLDDAQHRVDRVLALRDNRADAAFPDGDDRAIVLAARIASARGRHDEALARTERALPTAQPDLRADLHELRGDQLAALGRDADAEAAYRAAMAATEEMWARVGFLELRQELAARHRAPFEALFDILARRGDWPQAIEIMERLAARGHRDAIVAAATAPTPDVAGGSIDRYADRAAARADKLTQVIGALTAVPAAAAPVGLAARLRGRHIVGFVAARGALWRVVLRDGAITGQRLAELERVRRLVDAMLVRPDDLGVAGELGALLFEGALPAAGANLEIVPDPSLARLPIAAVRIRGGYLIERHPIALIPTLGAAVAVPARTWSAPVVLGDPGNDLSSARSEAVQVAARVGARPLLGLEATREALTGARRASVLHVASHLLVDPTGPLLRLADGDLGTAELLALRLAPRLAVLAGCGSAVGTDGDPWQSAASALLAAGARGVVATTRSVADAAAAQLILDFYDAGGCDHPAEALAIAQRRAIARGEPAAAWAAFVYLGPADS